MKKLRKKVFALLLVGVLTLSSSILVSAASFAFVTDDATLTAAINSKTPIIIIVNSFTVYTPKTIDYDVSIAASSETTLTTYSCSIIFNVTGDNVTISFQNVILRTSRNDGIAINSTANSLTIIDGQIAEGFYGIKATKNLIINGGKYSYCSTAIYCEGVFTLEDGVISGNSNHLPAGYGSAIYSTGTVNINGGEIVNNSGIGRAYSYGGGIYITGGTLNINGGLISNNYVYGCGGGIYMENSTFYMRAGTITENIASYSHGSGFYIVNSRFYMYGGTITNNDSNIAESSTVYLYGGTIQNLNYQ